MARLGSTFNANEVEPSQGTDVVPPGPYELQIVQSEMKDAKNNPGAQYLNLELDILSGPYKGRKLFDNLNLVHPNQQTVSIAERILSAICHATGTLVVDDSEQLHLKPMIADVRIKPADGQYAAQNKIVAYKPISGFAPAAGRAAAQTARPAYQQNTTRAAAPVNTVPVQNTQAPPPAARPATERPWARRST
ncbi:MAG: DUF669 domain-containing protein [Azospirillum sp.]|nr:DUF669 domain-containing protein [Azospirillum sp.]